MALIDKASLLMVPSVYEDGTLYNVLPSGNKAPDETGNHNGYDQTRADFTFSRGSNLAATRVNADGLIEKGRENIFKHSNAFTTSPWSMSATLTSGQADKDGGTNAWLFTKSGLSNSDYYNDTTINGVQTFSIYAKKQSGVGIKPYFFGSVNGYATINLGDGSKYDASGAIIDYKAEAYNDNWWRISVTINASSGNWYIYVTDGTNTQTTTPITIQDAQLEAGLVATEYIETGATTATAGVLENTPRIDYSSGAGALLLEPQRTNLVTQSEYFGSSDWSKLSSGTGSAPVVTDNYAISPEGVKNAARIVFDKGSGTTTSDFSLIQYSVSTDGVGSIYLKGESGGESVTFIVRGASFAVLELTTEWQRFDLYSAILNQLTIRVRGDQNSNDTATIYAYGAQCENASHVSSYVPTYGSAATRGADIVDGKEDSSLYNDSEGVLFVEFSALSATRDNEFRFMISDGTNDDRIQIGLQTGGDLYASVIENNSATASFNYTLPNPTQTHKVAIKYKANDCALWVDGIERGTDISATMPSGLDVFDFYRTPNNNNYVEANVKQVIYFDEALSDSELAALTA